MKLHKIENSDELKKLLEGLVERSEAVTASLISREGMCLSKAGKVET